MRGAGPLDDFCRHSRLGVGKRGAGDLLMTTGPRWKVTCPEASGMSPKWSGVGTKASPLQPTNHIPNR